MYLFSSAIKVHDILKVTQIVFESLCLYKGVDNEMLDLTKNASLYLKKVVRNPKQTHPMIDFTHLLFQSVNELIFGHVIFLLFSTLNKMTQSCT